MKNSIVEQIKTMESAGFDENTNKQLKIIEGLRKAGFIKEKRISPLFGSDFEKVEFNIKKRYQHSNV